MKIEITHAELIELVDLATSVLALFDQCTAGPWTVVENDGRRRLKIISPEPWRRRPPVQMGWGYEEHADVAEICGGKADEARANGEALALSRDATPALAKAVIRMAKLIVEKRLLPDTVPDAPLPIDVAAIREAGAINMFYQWLADALDGLFVEANYGEVSDRNAEPIRRLLSGDEGRELRWELLARVAKVLDPSGDDARMKELPPQSRVAAKARPQRQDFHDAIPELIRMGLRGEPTSATDGEVAAELVPTLTGSEHPRPAEVKAAVQRIRQARGVT